MPPFKVCLIDLNSAAHELNEPYAVELLKGQLLRGLGCNLNVELLSTSIHSLLDIYAAVGSADVVAFSLNEWNLELAEDVVSKSFAGLIVFGGIFPSVMYPAVLERFPDAIVIIGEGERSLVDVLQAYVRDQNNYRLFLQSTSGVALLVDSRLYFTPPKVVELEDIAPPARDFLLKTPHSFTGIARIEASRGCNWGRCVFCSINNRFCDSSKRFLPVSYIVDQICELHNLGISKVFFNDEDFLDIEPSHLLQLLSAVASVGVPMKYFISASVSSVLRLHDDKLGEELFTLMAHAGITDVFLGIESGSNTQLQRYQKGVSVEDNVKAMHLITSLGFKLDVGFILFDPYLTETELLENIQFIERMPYFGFEIDSRLIKKMLIIPFTQMHDQATSDGLIIPSYNSMYFDYNFKDPLVQDLYESYASFEKRGVEVVAKLQTHLRLEVSPRYRKILSKLLGTIRWTDLQVLRSLVIKDNQQTISLMHEKEQLLARITTLCGPPASK